MTDMQRRHFELIADTIKGLGEAFESDTVEHIARKFADALATTNAQFKRDTFLKRATGKVPESAPLKALRKHVTGAIERGEAIAIVGKDA